MPGIRLFIKKSKSQSFAIRLFISNLEMISITQTLNCHIMFVSVKERTNLIGIQKSLGAKRKFILFQFFCAISSAHISDQTARRYRSLKLHFDFKRATHCDIVESKTNLASSAISSLVMFLILIFLLLTFCCKVFTFLFNIAFFKTSVSLRTLCSSSLAISSLGGGTWTTTGD